MERKTVTITIDNVPESLLKDFWRDAIREAKRDPGVPIERVDNIVIDFNLMEENPDVISELFSAAATCHVVQTVDKIFNS